MTPHILEIENQSLNLLKQYCLDSSRKVINTNSTGKDSMVVTHLAQKAELMFETYFNVTTLDVAESNRMAKRNGFNYIYPNPRYGGFYQYIRNFDGNGNQVVPSRLNRFCCKYFKEMPTIDNFDKDQKLIFLFGMRNQESSRRSVYQDVWINSKWGDRDWLGLLPIRKWSEFDIWIYTLLEGIEINEKYRYGYDRVGCGIACPNYTKYTWVLDQYWYPHLFNRWRTFLRENFIRDNKWLIMNCTVKEYVSKAWNGGTYRPEPTEEVIKEFAQYSGLDITLARNYFDRHCANGCLNKRRKLKKIKDKEILAMNMKLFGRNINRFLCKECLMKEFGWTPEIWESKVNDFKSHGCQLF